MKKTLTFVLTNEKGYIRPFFWRKDETFSKLIEKTKSEMAEDYEWENDYELKSIAHHLIASTIFEKEADLDMCDEITLESLSALYAHLNTKEFVEQKNIIVFDNIEDITDAWKSKTICINADKEERLIPFVKKVYKNDDTLLDSSLQSELVYKSSLGVIRAVMGEMGECINQQDNSGIVSCINACIPLTSACVLLGTDMKEDPEHIEANSNLFHSLMEMKSFIEEETINEKIKDLMN